MFVARSAPLILVLAFGFAPSTQASVIYSYVGNPYNTIEDRTPPAGTFDSSMRLTLTFEVAAPLAPNLIKANITPILLHYAFSDGRSQLTESTPFTHPFFIVTTNGSGEISEWQMDATYSQPGSVVGERLLQALTLNFPSAGPGFVRDLGFLAECVQLTSEGLCSFSSESGTSWDAPGTWSIVPEPTTGSLVALGLAWIGGISRTPNRSRKLATSLQSGQRVT